MQPMVNAMPEDSVHQTLFAALVAANYHAAKATTRYGGDWADRVKWLERRQSPVLARIPPLGHAKKLVDDVDRPEERTTLWTHARGAVDRARLLTHKAGAGQRPHIPLAKNANPEKLIDIVQVLNELALENAKFEVNRSSYDPTSGLSEFGATLRYLRRPEIDTFENWERGADPRHWSAVLPEMFARSDEIEPPFVDPRDDDPPVDTDRADTGAPEFYLFEDARLKLIGLPLTCFRNVLKIDFRTTKPVKSIDDGTLTLTYSLYESLTSVLLDLPRREGGIDVDSCELGDTEVTLQGKDIAVKAAKRIRFSAESDFSVELNLLALPFLEAWITELLIGGATAGRSHRRQSLPPFDSIPAAAQ